MVFGPWFKSALSATVVGAMVWLGPSAVAQEFRIPSPEQLAQMSAIEKVEFERQLTAEAVGWPKVSLNEGLDSLDPMEVPHPIRSGDLAGTDALHQASGNATIFDLGNDELVLRIADGDIAVGPGLHVYLVKTRSPQSAEQIQTAGFLDLGPLKAHLGNHNYPVPGGIGAYRSVVIYSQPFGVIFAVASIQ